MSNPAVLSIQNAYVTFGGKPLFEDIDVHIHSGDKICLVGKNGAGKTTLMKLICNELELGEGKRITAPGLKIGFLQQEVTFDKNDTVFDFVFKGLDKEDRTDENQYYVSMVISPLDLEENQKMNVLSGGQLRRAALARSLIQQPDILLLDEPTNHLDIEAIEWLEGMLNSYKGALLCISHDKRFLEKISNKVFWLDRGKVRVCPKGFKYFDEWSGMLLEQEARELENRQRILAGEVEWASRGVKARRKRNVRRLDLMHQEREKLKHDQSRFRQATKKVEVKLDHDQHDVASKLVCEFYRASKSFENGTVPILKDFSFKIMRGDRIGILGKNGSGKSTFIKSLLKQIEPDSGTVKLNKFIEPSYFDQDRSTLDNSKTLWETLCPEGGDYIEVGGKKRHVCGYLKDFLFDPKIAKDKVGTLSGGQKNRLMLAKVLANPKNLLILDEPTNDLDMETMDMLEETLCHYQGTLLVVSHDRDFLDQTVSQLLVFEGNANVVHCIGNYDDYVRIADKPSNPDTKKPQTPPKQQPTKPKKIKLSYKETYDLEHLPAQIETYEKEIAQLNEALSDSELYNSDPDGFASKVKRLDEVKKLIDQSETRLLELMEKKDNLEC